MHNPIHTDLTSSFPPSDLHRISEAVREQEHSPDCGRFTGLGEIRQTLPAAQRDPHSVRQQDSHLHGDQEAG